ncbi:hypothetical protein BDV95DRAFT_639084 [Massariosphaeria phaeospora]|uniref:Rhodopsin domain-containing protein n=1 Tax=Massariosphaeria phaeospora TaxID=100035 RepID=A0A7C8MLS2_9PLEO|nr:hypothetical protein BDV95DRAFT_639084 [Massariosphaeria phaeospora]
MGCARISVCLLIRKVLPGTVPQWTATVFAVFTALWTVSGVLVTAFPCRLPEVWRLTFGQKNCYDIIKFVNYIGITNIVVEVLLVFIPLLRSIVAAVAAQLSFFNHYSHSKDFTYDYWRSVLCVQIAQNLSIITACLPCMHPFIIGILAGREKTDALLYKCPARQGIKDCLKGKSFKFDSTSSQSSVMPMKHRDDDDDEYCRPLATYGLDRSSAHLNSQHFNRFPANTAKPVFDPTPPQNVFNRVIAIPPSRPLPAGAVKDLPPIPHHLGQVGVLPTVDWDTDSDRDSGASSHASRRRGSDYVFSRSKVVSVPEADAMMGDGEYYKKYYPPLPSPGMPKWARGP